MRYVLKRLFGKECKTFRLNFYDSFSFKIRNRNKLVRK